MLAQSRQSSISSGLAQGGVIQFRSFRLLIIAELVSLLVVCI